MLPSRRLHLRTAWLALLLAALVALAPTVARAMAHVQGQIAPWATLCTAADLAGGNGLHDALQHLTAHCPACLLHNDALVPLQAALAGLAVCPAAVLPAAGSTVVQAARVPWSRGQPRAPPAAS